MRIWPNPMDANRLWWYFHPKVIYARVHAIYSDDLLPVIWVRPLDKEETAQVEKMMGTA
jgi:hypothetical protein